MTNSPPVISMRFLDVFDGIDLALHTVSAARDTDSGPRMARSGRAATKVPEPRMEHGLNTERESALMALEKEEITEKISSQLHLKGLFWESVFHPCSIRGSPENLVGRRRKLASGALFV